MLSNILTKDNLKKSSTFVGGFVTSTYFLDSIKREILYLIFGIYSLIVGYIFVKKSKLIF